jgi:hypothetical protein
MIKYLELALSQEVYEYLEELEQMNWSARGNVLNQYLRNTSIGTTVKVCISTKASYSTSPFANLNYGKGCVIHLHVCILECFNICIFCNETLHMHVFEPALNSNGIRTAPSLTLKPQV